MLQVIGETPRVAKLFAMLAVASTSVWTYYTFALDSWPVSLLSTFGVIVSVLGASAKISRQLKDMNEKITRLLIEHEILVGDYCERHEISKSDLPTRTGLE